MDLVVDANIIFAILIKEGDTARLLADERLRLFAPVFLLEEIRAHYKTLAQKTHRSAEDTDRCVRSLFEYVHFVPLEHIAPRIPEAALLTPDADDVTYIALALHLRAPIWSNDASFRRQTVVDVLSTAELYAILTRTPSATAKNINNTHNTHT